MLRMFFVVMMMVVATAALADGIKAEPVSYKSNGVELEGFVVWDAAKEGTRPGILIVHQWTGISDHERDVARRLAALGYVAFCADIYGKGIRPPAPQASGAEAGKYKGNRALFRERLNAALAEMKRHPAVDPANTAAIGYCFGGTGVIELARSGADVKGVVSFHGGLDSPAPADAANIKARVLVLHGADDPFIPEADLAAFQKEMRDAKVDWQMMSFGGAVHSFTDKKADGSMSPGARYNEYADKRSWELMKDFLGELFAKPKPPAA